MCCSVFQDLQAEVDAHQGAYESLNSAGNQLARNMVTSDSHKLHKRLEDMNQRWLSLMSKSMEIRYGTSVFVYFINFFNFCLFLFLFSF